MPSDSNNSPGTPPVSSAGSTPPETTGEIDDILRQLPPRQETDRLLAEAAALQDELFRQTFARLGHVADADVIDDLAEMDFDDPRYLIIDEPPTEGIPE